jgi:hypothetical protein
MVIVAWNTRAVLESIAKYIQGQIGTRIQFAITIAVINTTTRYIVAINLEIGDVESL